MWICYNINGYNVFDTLGLLRIKLEVIIMLINLNIKFEMEKIKVIKAISHIGDLDAMEVKSKYPELWQALIDVETTIEEN